MLDKRIYTVTAYVDYNFTYKSFKEILEILKKNDVDYTSYGMLEDDCKTLAKDNLGQPESVEIKFNRDETDDWEGLLTELNIPVKPVDADEVIIYCED